MSKLEITWLYDEHDCEVCGYSDSIGAVATLDGKEIFNQAPSASCFDALRAEPEDVYRAALVALGVEIVENDEEEA